MKILILLLLLILALALSFHAGYTMRTHEKARFIQGDKFIQEENCENCFMVLSWRNGEIISKVNDCNHAVLRSMIQIDSFTISSKAGLINNISVDVVSYK